ncbi:Rubisco LSMT substrate-binding [Phytophthora infestans]|uniref:Rubisco LSMT substrate-binding n=1 Tax=Phytophthora infestans TaxID=4787 RepID=A0A833TC56_PHYIN|nr:Rubisco LSMT substrate-binding [Phytophthora infestans]
MRKRPNKYNTAVTAVSHNDVAQPNKNTSSGQSKQANNTSSISIFAFILIVGALLTQTSRFANLNAVPDQLSEQEKVAAFVNWFRAEGGNVSDKIAINKFPEMGRGIVALQSVKENDNLLFVPKGIIICYDTIATEWSSHASLKKTLSKLKSDQEELLTAFLMLEQAKGHASRWAPYFQVLPSFISKNTVPSPLFSNEEDVDALQDERMIQTARTERQRAKKAYGRFKRLFRSFLDDKTMSLSRYLWTRFLVNSRAFSIRGQRVLVPFGDIFNGEPDDEARQQDNGQRFLLFHDLQPQGMTIRADRDTLSGQHLFEDYGDNSNYVYFLHHGFLMSDKGFDCAVFRLPRLAEASLEDSGILASKLHILSRIRVDDAPQVCISRAGNVEDSDLVRVYTALYNMNAEQVRACDNARAFSECFPSELMPDLDTELGYHELSLLLKSIKLQLEKYATTLEEDQTILQHLTDVTVSGNKHAVTFRLSRKQILREAQRNLATQLKNSERKAKNDVSEPQLSPSKELELEEVGNKLERFQQWIARHHFPVNSLELRYVSEAVGYGTFAVKRLAIGDVYLKVPVQVVMNVWSAVKSRWVSQTMQELQKQRVSVDREEMLLLLHLLEEKFGPNHRHSFWKPYLEMLPDLEDSLNSPLFYEEVELKTLEGTDLLTLVVNYRKRVARSYVTIASYLKQSGHDETLQWLTERRFRWANAVLDSRSIWWSGQRHLVPLLDMVNCQELNVNHKPHHTILDSSGRHAVTKSSWEFQAGQEVVENYAQTNYIYLLYHGFVLDSNSHDCAHFHLEMPVAARHRRFSVLLRSLEIFSWTPDLCVFPSDSESIMRFSKIALFVSDPEKALRLAGNAATAPSQATAAALKLVEDRLTRLESTTADMSTTDFRTQSILKFRLQQLHQLATLRNKLLPKKIK